MRITARAVGHDRLGSRHGDARRRHCFSDCAGHESFWLHPLRLAVGPGSALLPEQRAEVVVMTGRRKHSRTSLRFAAHHQCTGQARADEQEIRLPWRSERSISAHAREGGHPAIFPALVFPKLDSRLRGNERGNASQLTRCPHPGHAQYPLMPAKAGIQPFFLHWFFLNWIPANAGTSGRMLRN